MDNATVGSIVWTYVSWKTFRPYRIVREEDDSGTRKFFAINGSQLVRFRASSVYLSWYGFRVPRTMVEKI